MWRVLGLACGLLLALPASAQEGAQEAFGIDHRVFRDYLQAALVLGSRG